MRTKHGVVRRRDDGVLDMMVPHLQRGMVAIDRRDFQAGDPGRRRSLSAEGLVNGQPTQPGAWPQGHRLLRQSADDRSGHRLRDLCRRDAHRRHRRYCALLGDRTDAGTAARVRLRGVENARGRAIRTRTGTASGVLARRVLSGARFGMPSRHQRSTTRSTATRSPTCTCTSSPATPMIRSSASRSRDPAWLSTARGMNSTSSLSRSKRRSRASLRTEKQRSEARLDRGTRRAPPIRRDGRCAH
jgi:hypothetical protein